MQTPREEYPRPQLVREAWQNLNGHWLFAFDDEDKGRDEEWFKQESKRVFDKTIMVPYTYQCEMSGINDQDFHDIVWYQKTVELAEKDLDEVMLLHFGAVDYRADLWVNGTYVMAHEGGHVSFHADVTRELKVGENSIVLRVFDPSKDLSLPRGKQYWKRSSEGIFYTRTTGIWQTVWLEPLKKKNLQRLWLTPDVDRKMLHMEYEVTEATKGCEMTLEVSLDGSILLKEKFSILNDKGKKGLYLDQGISDVWQFFEMWTWCPERPILFDMVLTIYEGERVTDKVETYFGMRKVEVVDGIFMLNNRPYYQKMLLDQGYWEPSLLTAPTDEAFIKDIELAKEMGFNGVRKHMKVEDPRFLYHADRMGFIVWGEMAGAYVYSRTYVERMTKEWLEVIARDYNHPSIVAWTPLNESWGVDGIMNNYDEQAHAAAMYYLTKSLDPMRMVISNDGWDHTKSDLLTIHDYEYKYEVLKERYSSLESILASRPATRGLMARGWSYEGQPIIVSEFGGISFKTGSWDGWGYSSADSPEDFLERYNNVIKPLLESKAVQGFVYTQITDVEQEINGLLTYDRKPKVALDQIKAINEGRYKQ